MPCPTLVCVRSDTGRATVGEHAIVAENPSRQRKHHRMLYQLSEIRGFVDQIPDTLRLIVIKQRRQVKEILNHLLKEGRATAYLDFVRVNGGCAA